jgi:hypothetical protein
MVFCFSILGAFRGPSRNKLVLIRTKFAIHSRIPPSSITGVIKIQFILTILTRSKWLISLILFFLLSRSIIHRDIESGSIFSRKLRLSIFWWSILHTDRIDGAADTLNGPSHVIGWRRTSNMIYIILNFHN